MATIKTLNNLEITIENQQENVVWSDIDKTFTLVNNDMKLLKNYESVVQSLWTILLTRKGEMPFLNAFGTNLNSYVFEQGSSEMINTIKDEFIREINVWDDRVEIVDVKTSTVTEQGIVEINLLFKINGEVYKQSFPVPQSVTL